MASNEFKAFANGPGANALTPTALAALTTLLNNGFQAGTASSAQINTVLRQVSTMVAALAQLVADRGTDARDSGNVATLRDALAATLLNRKGDTGLTGDFTTAGTWTGYHALPVPGAYWTPDLVNDGIVFNFDLNDFQYYSRVLNAWSFVIAGINRMYIDQFGPGRNDDATTPNGLPRLSQVARPGRAYAASDWAWIDQPAGLFEQWFDCVYNGADGGAGTVITLPYAYTTGVLAFSACDVLNGVNACSIAPIDATKVRVWGRAHDGTYATTTMHVRLIGR